MVAGAAPALLSRAIATCDAAAPPMASGRALETAVAIDPQYLGELRKVTTRVRSLAVFAVDIDDRRRPRPQPTAVILAPGT